MADDWQLSLYSKYCSQTDILFVLWNPVRCFKLRLNKISIKAIYGLVFQKVFPVWDTKLYTPRKNIKKTLSLKSNHIFFFKCATCAGLSALLEQLDKELYKNLRKISKNLDFSFPKWYFFFRFKISDKNTEAIFFQFSVWKMPRCIRGILWILIFIVGSQMQSRCSTLTYFRW